ncbi:MAG: hypothetical protein ABSH48_24135 [Verrucomicrobiota bacterium]
MNAKQQTDPDSGWQKTPYANLQRYNPSGNYFAQIRVRGKLIRRSQKIRGSRSQIFGFQIWKTQNVNRVNTSEQPMTAKWLLAMPWRILARLSRIEDFYKRLGNAHGGGCGIGHLGGVAIEKKCPFISLN